MWSLGNLPVSPGPLPPGWRRSCHCRLFQCPHLDASSDGFLPKTQKQEQIQAGKRRELQAGNPSTETGASGHVWPCVPVTSAGSLGGGTGFPAAVNYVGGLGGGHKRPGVPTQACVLETHFTHTLQPGFWFLTSPSL